ncbi:Ig-like domain-containing alpha-2-macroglobulin family protein [Cloacibacillus sp. An23]|uniref:Ig-like domain-containing alpha-2-macroglobulin family protein n=1 Tax=Cloacibacillus sp. An23 TaxID=1965591 RepID=UPI000B37DD19|nr:Ig-like domain-containing alpha-2-macroglobulin family protein [Cloacibacillus sp. An23]OUO93314.1 hypothetical protein B5F39_08445 [Cloacibacillus sp. An23]
MEHRRLLSGGVLAACAVFAALALFAAPVLGGKGGFYVRSFSPQGETGGAVEITARFSEAAVADDAVGKKLAPSESPFVFSPEIAGAGEWRDGSTFVFTPSGGRLAPATRYTATARDSLASAGGEALSGARSFTFSTPALAFTGAKQTDFDQQSGRTEFELEFSLPVSPSRLRGYAEVKDEKGGTYDYALTQTVSKKIRLSVGAARAERLFLSIAAGLPSEAGPLGLEKAVSVELKRSLVMELRGARAESGMDGGRIIIETTAPVDLAKAASFIEISPKKDFTVEPYGGGFALASKGFGPQDRVKVTIKKGFPALSGRALAAEWSRAFIFPDVEPSVRFPEPGSVISPEDSMRVPVESVNFDRLRVIIWKLYDNNIPLAARGGYGEYNYPTDLSRYVVAKEFSVKGRPNETARRALDLRPLLGGERGVFLVIAQGQGRAWSEARRMINVTDLGLTVSVGESGAVARVLSVSTAKPVAGAKVTLWSHSNQPVGTGVTGADGTARIALTPDDERGRPYTAVAEKDGDASYINLFSGLFGGNDEFDTGGLPWVERGYSAYCWTPRDIFRPGEKIPVFAIVRGADGKAPEPFPMKMKVWSPGKLWTTLDAKLTAEGVFASELELPAEAQTGSWGFELSVPGSERALCYKSVYVEDFASPRMFVEASAKPASVTGNGKTEINISARHAFGSPASGMAWEAELRLIDKNFEHEKWKGFSFRDEEKKFSPESRLFASGELDADGKAVAALECGGWSVPSMLGLSVRAGVMDDGGRWTYETVIVPWYPSEVMAGIDMPDNAAPGRAVNFRAAAVKTDGSPAPVKEMKYSFFLAVRRAVVFESEGRMSRRVEEELIPRGEGVIKLTDGVGKGAVTPKEPGQYLLRVETADGSSRASSRLYVYGAGGEGGTELPDAVTVTTDKKSYKVGETAKIKIKSPFVGSVLLSVATSSPRWEECRAISGKTAEFSVKVTEEMKPNAWITAHVVRPASKDGRPPRAFGAAPLLVDNSDSRLTVEIAPVPEMKPGENKISLSVKDAAGRGAAADVTLMVTDETVLGLTGYETPAPWEFFTGRRQLGVETYDLYGSMLTPEKPGTPLLTAGGGMGAEMDAAMASRMMKMQNNLSPVQAQRFRTLCLTARARTDENGKCSVTLDVPEFSGTARVMAIAATPSAEGAGETETRIARDVVTEPSLPRFAAPGDVFEAPCRLFNMTGKPIEVILKAESLDESKLASMDFSCRDYKKLTIEPNGSVTVPLRFQAKGAGVAKVRFTTEWPGGSAVSETELPVRPAAPRVTESGFKTLEPGGKWSFALPGAGRDGAENFAQVTAALSAMPQLSISSVARMLASYPYGCFEQTVSAAWTRIFAPELVKGLDPALADGGAAASAIRAIEARQNYDGGFPRRSGESWSRPWESLYGAHFLLEARRMGYEVSGDVLRSAVEYARALLPAAPSDESDEAWRDTLTRRAYASFVLALAGEAPLGWMESLNENAGQMAPSGRLLLASAYAAAGDKKSAMSLIGKPSAAPKSAGGGDNFDSALRDEALRLLARTYAEPAGAETAAAASALIEKINSGARLTTQEGGFAVASLGRWFAANPSRGTPSGALSCAGFDGKVNAKTPSVTSDKAGEYTARNTGKARLYAAWSVSYIPTGGIKQRDDGIELRQRIAERSGKAVEGSVERGAALTATVTVTPKSGALKDVAVVLPLPAGFEIEEARLAADGEQTPAGVTADERDDRLVLYIDRLEKPLTWRYAMRAVTEGYFAVPQIYAECMYDAGISSVSGGGTIKVNAAK